jgi:Domain of unknown function (DUF4249)
MKNRIYIYFLLALALTSCLDEIKLKQPAIVQKLVVEGGLTDVKESFFLRLSYTDGVGAPKRISPTAGVYVEIQSTKGLKKILRADPLGSGLFTPEDGSFVGQAGESYFLYIKLADGREYRTLSQTMPIAVPISSLNYVSTETPRLGYSTMANIADPKEAENYYRWKAEGFSIRRSVGIKVGFGDNYCCNVCWVKEFNESINMLSDQNFNGNTIKNQSVFFSQYYGLGAYKVKVSQYNISKEAFQYYLKLKSQLGRTGSIFDPLPATVRGNIVNINDNDDTSLGFFEVASVSTKEIQIQDEKLIKYDEFYRTPIYVPSGDCMLSYPYSLYFESYNQKLF